MIGKTARYILVIMAFSLFLSGVVPTGDAVAGPGNIAGSYAVSGWNPGSNTTGPPQYQGIAELTAWGDAWKYRGFMDGTAYVGVGVFDPLAGVLSLSFRSEDGSESGVTTLRMVGDRFSGHWVFAGVGNGILGAETWTRKP